MRQVTDEDIYKYLLGPNVKVWDMYCSPIPEEYRAQDDTPSFGLYEEDGVVKWKDFGLSSPYGNKAVNLLMYMRKLPMDNNGFRQAMQIINGEIKRGMYGEDVTKLQRRKTSERKLPYITWNENHYTGAELAYWLRYGITEEDLRRERIYPLDRLSWTGSDEAGITSTDDDPAYVYILREPSNDRGFAFKVYRPLTRNKRDKFRQWNVSDIVEGWISFKEEYEYWTEDQKPIFLGTSSTKDRIVIKKCGFASLNPTGENAWRKFEAITPYLTDNFPRRIWMMDADDAGFRASRAASQDIPDWEYVDMRGRLGRWKDFSDYVDTEKGNHSYNDLISLINNLL